MDKQNKQTEDKISQIFNNPHIVQNAMQAAINSALINHKKLGDPICEWVNDKVVWIAPENIKIKADK